MAGMRDRLIHHYFGIDWSIVWNVVKDEFPRLENELESIYEEEFG